MDCALVAVVVVWVVVPDWFATSGTSVHFFLLLIHTFTLSVIKGKHNLKPKKVIHSLFFGLSSFKAPGSGYQKTSSLIY